MQDRTNRVLLALIAVALWGLLLRPAFAPGSAAAGGVHRTWMRIDTPSAPYQTTWVDLEQADTIAFGKNDSGPMATIFAPGRSTSTRNPGEVQRLRQYISTGVLPR